MNKLSIHQLDLFLKNKFVYIFPHTEDVSISIQRIKQYSSKHDGDFLIYIRHEIIPYQEYFDKIINLVQSLPNNIWIMSSTASTHPNMVEPIVNTIMFKDTWVDWNGDSYYEELFTPMLYDSIPWGEKKIKSILSIKRKTEWRDLVFPTFTNIPIEIKRYVGGGLGEHPPDWNTLTKEYLDTFVACVVETHYPTETSFTCFTEKSILAFLCGNIPLILGRRGLIKELESMGLWIANNDFGFELYDNTIEDISKIEAYSRCVKRIHQIDIGDYFLKNIKKIENNHKLISEIFLKKNNKVLV